MKEHLKEHLKECLRNYFIIVTGINLAVFILGMIFKPDQKLGYDAFLYPIVYGALTSIPNLLMVEKKEPTVRQTIFREIIGVILISAILLTTMFGGMEITGELIIISCGIVLSVICITLMVNAVSWILDSRKAESLTNDLVAFQNKING
ncbi:MAG: hypothetical protein J5476_01320 [Lachnospiraceae bacterium]|nr:hypothetical protein [Lachnospiraceae bacterium]